MLNRIAILWILYAGLAGTFLGGSLQSALFSPIQEQYGDQQRNKADKGPTLEERRQTTDEALANYTLWLERYTGLLFFATLGMFIATVGLYAANKDQVKIVRDEFAASHRPKIRLKHLWLANDIFLGNGPIIVNIMCVNTGTSVGTLGRFGIRFHVVKNKHLLPANASIDATLTLAGEPPLGVNWPISNLDTSHRLSPQDRIDIQQRRAKLYCVGWISYGHIPQGIRITGFCRVLDAPKGEATLTMDNARFRVSKHPDYEYED